MWRLDAQQRTALLSSDKLAAQIGIEQPQRGIERIAWCNQQLNSQVLRVVLCAFEQQVTVADCYVRGSDVVIAYSDPPQQKNVRPQLYWRFIDDRSLEARGVELVLSIETDLLDSDPHARVESHLSGTSAFARKASGWETINTAETRLNPAEYQPLVVVQGNSWSYAEMIYPSDFTEATIRKTDRGWQTTWDLFPEHLEKGVIRRARLRGVFFAGTQLTHADAALQSFQASPLPLTT